jgi:hypothetical protein
MPYPVSLTVTPAVAGRNRLTTAFRFILAIPHLLLVGGGGIAIASGGRDSELSFGDEGGLLGAVAVLLAIVSWFTILISGTHIAGIRQFTAFYLRWRTRALAYFMLLADPYPPFGDGPYPASIDVVDPAAPRDRISVAFRLLLVIPHCIVLLFVLFAWTLTTIVGWFSILLTGTFPEGLHQFGVGAMRWQLRVEAYLYLMVDEYPPFSLQ